MKKRIWLVALALFASVFWMGDGCDPAPATSDSIQRDAQEKLLQEGTAQTGMPAIKNFRERKMLKNILELRDQEGLVTFTYLENLTPMVVHGRTALGGKLTYLGESVGYGIPYATEFTNPQKTMEGRMQGEFTAIAQADPNGLFSPASAEGTWVLMKNPNGRDVQPVYIEPRILVSPFQYPFDN